jgi:hypothetical protein
LPCEIGYLETAGIFKELTGIDYKQDILEFCPTP